MYSFQSPSLTSDSEIFCPNCIKPINLSIFNKNNNNNDVSMEIEIDEFTKLTCPKCSFQFSFLYCEICKQKIFMKIHPNSENIKYNGLNGYNIKCTSESCNKIFYFTVCSKCNKPQKISRYIKEGDIIECIFCKFQYIQAHIPIKYSTEVINIENNQIYHNFPNGLILTIANKVKYQKINCYYCLRPIVFSSDKNHLNKYIESQQVECPYSDCKQIFNRIICLSCNNKIYIDDGFYDMGSLIECNNDKCKDQFGKIFCPHCKRVNTCKKKFKLGLIQCGFENCQQKSNMVNCIFCKKLNIFNLNININGKMIKCGYCKKKFNVVLCPSCKKINPFPLADFAFGKIYKCQYLSCMKNFQFIICPKCLNYSFGDESSEGQKMKCGKCQIRFINFGCPFCKSSIIIYNSSFIIGKMVRCPNEKCRKIYSFINCSKCQKLIFSQENENLIGKFVVCPYQSCNSSTVSIICPLCKTNIQYPNIKKGIAEGQDIKCEKCKKIYKFHNNNEFCSSEIIYLKEYEGNKIDYGVGEVDDNYLSIAELFSGFCENKNISILQRFSTFSNLNKQVCFEDKKITFKDCIICHNSIRESVFYPCGHRCTCYNCAVIAFAVTKKCPKCKKDASCIIKKVYE